MPLGFLGVELGPPELDVSFIYWIRESLNVSGVTVALSEGVSFQLLACVLTRAWLFGALWTDVACQALLSMGFSRQEYWSGLPFPPLGIFLTQGLNDVSVSLAMAGRFFTTSPSGKPQLFRKSQMGSSWDGLYIHLSNWVCLMAPCGVHTIYRQGLTSTVWVCWSLVYLNIIYLNIALVFIHACKTIHKDSHWLGCEVDLPYPTGSLTLLKQYFCCSGI